MGRNRGVKKTGWLLPLLLAGLLAAGCSSSDKAETSAAADVMPQAGAAASNEMANASKVVVMDQSSAGQAAAGKDQAGNGQGGGLNSATGATAAGTAIPPEGVIRKLIYKANLTMKVKDYSQAQAEIRDLTALAGGYIVQFSENSSTREQGGQFVLKIPSGGFSSFLKDLEKIPHLQIQHSMQAQDVSEEYVDLEARLKAKQIQEGRYLDFMQKASKTDDLVAFSNQLGKVQEEIEQIKGRMRFIDQNVAYSTVEIRVYQPDGPIDPLQEEEEARGVLGRAWKAMSASLGFLSSLGQGLLVTAAALLPVILVLSVIGVPAGLLYRKAKRKRAAEQEQERQKRLGYNRILTGDSPERQDTGKSDSGRQDPNR